WYRGGVALHPQAHRGPWIDLLIGARILYKHNAGIHRGGWPIADVGLEPLLLQQLARFGLCLANHHRHDNHLAALADLDHHLRAHRRLTAPRCLVVDDPRTDLSVEVLLFLDDEASTGQ